MRTVVLLGYKITLYIEKQIKYKDTIKIIHYKNTKPCNRCSKPATHGNHCEDCYFDYMSGY